MSWLLIAATPTLLMLAAVGLERIETRLNTPPTADTEVAALLAAAEQGSERPNTPFHTLAQAHHV